MGVVSGPTNLAFLKSPLNAPILMFPCKNVKDALVSHNKSSFLQAVIIKDTLKGNFSNLQKP